MKISAQRKIAELESRIAALEKAVNIQRDINHTFSTPWEPSVRAHWDRMWEEFGHVMKAAFGKQ